MKIDRKMKDIIASAIEERGLSHTAIAKKIGVGQSTLWNFIYGKTENFGKLPQLADAVGLPLATLLGKDKASPDHPIDREVFIDAVIKAALNESETPAQKIIDLTREDLRQWINQDTEVGAKSSLSQLIRVVRMRIGKK